MEFERCSVWAAQNLGPDSASPGFWLQGDHESRAIHPRIPIMASLGGDLRGHTLPYQPLEMVVILGPWKR